MLTQLTGRRRDPISGSRRTVTSWVRPLRSDAVSFLQADSSKLLLDRGCRAAEQQLAAVVLYALQRVGKDHNTCDVDAGHLSKVEDDLAVALTVDDVDQPSLRAGAVFASGGPWTCTTLPRGATEHQ